MILNQKIPVVKMIPQFLAAEGRGRGPGAMVTPIDLKSDCIKEIACLISIFCK